VTPTAENELYAMPRAVEVMIENISVPRWNQSSIYQAAGGDHGSTEELAFRMYI
jgi:hypothetical protein